MIKTIKAIIMDGDGSTLTHDNKLPQSLRDLMVENRQMKWIMATGRSLDLLYKTPIVEYLTEDVPHIVDGGARLMFLNGRIIRDYLISSEELTQLFSNLNVNAINFMYYSPDGINGYAYSAADNFSENFKFRGNNVTYTNKIHQFKEWAYNQIPAKILLNVKDHIGLEGLYYHRNDDNIDITASGINKGSACAELLNILKLSPDEVVFIFNDKNDLPIIEHKLLKNLVTVKVGDWLPDIVSTYHVDSPHHVSEVIKKLIHSYKGIL